LGDVGAQLNLTLLEGRVVLLSGDATEAATIARGLLKRVETLGYDSLQGEVLRLLGRTVLQSDGASDEGLGSLRKSVQAFKEQERLYEQGMGLCILAEALFERKGYCDEAVAALNEAQVVFERIGAVAELRRIQRFRAEHFSDWRDEKGLSSIYLAGLKRMSELVNYRLGEENFMIEMLSTALEITGAQRGMVFLSEGVELYSVASKGMDAATKRDARRLSRTIVQQIQHGLKPIYTADATKDERFKRSQSIILNNIRSFLCAPLKTSDRLIGTLYLDSQKVGVFGPENLTYFEAMANFLAATIEKSAEFTRMRDELRLARERRSWGKAGVVLGKSPLMQKLYAQLDRIAASDTSVLLEGETGTGKGVFARMIHERSPRHGHEFCLIDCGVVSEQLFEVELFGARKGAYTGAHEDRAGLLEAANGSTVFFDEITNTSAAVQIKLLEVIENRLIRRLGETRKRQVDLRFIFATNRDLEREVHEGRFREDLFFRINTLRLTLPPLRERREDIPEFASFFLEKSASELNKNVVGIDDEVLRAFLKYDWPGNIRELANVIERAVLLASGRRITLDLLDQRFFVKEPQGLKQTRMLQEKQLIQRILLETKWNVTRSARRLGITRQHLSRLIKRYRISRPYDSAPPS